jgi:hypothetical protein
VAQGTGHGALGKRYATAAAHVIIGEHVEGATFVDFDIVAIDQEASGATGVLADKRPQKALDITTRRLRERPTVVQAQDPAGDR